MGACLSSGKKPTAEGEEEEGLAAGRRHSGTIRMRLQQEKAEGRKHGPCSGVLLKSPKAKEEYLRNHESFRFFAEHLEMDEDEGSRRGGGHKRDHKRVEKLEAYLDECVELYCHALNRHGEARARGDSLRFRLSPPTQLKYKSFAAAFGLEYDDQVEMLCRIFDQARPPRRSRATLLTRAPPPLPTGRQQPHLLPRVRVRPVQVRPQQYGQQHQVCVPAV